MSVLQRFEIFYPRRTYNNLKNNGSSFVFWQKCRDSADTGLIRYADFFRRARYRKRIVKQIFDRVPGIQCWYTRGPLHRTRAGGDDDDGRRKRTLSRGTERKIVLSRRSVHIIVIVLNSARHITRLVQYITRRRYNRCREYMHTNTCIYRYRCRPRALYTRVLRYKYIYITVFCMNNRVGVHFTRHVVVALLIRDKPERFAPSYLYARFTYYNLYGGDVRGIINR